MLSVIFLIPHVVDNTWTNSPKTFVEKAMRLDDLFYGRNNFHERVRNTSGNASAEQ